MNMKKVVYPASPDTCGAVVGGTGARKKMTKEYRRERKVKGYFILLVHRVKIFCQTDIKQL